MFANIIKFKLYDPDVESFYKVVELKEPIEAGELLDGHRLILNDEMFGSDGKFPAGRWVNTVSIFGIDAFESDKILDLQNFRIVKESYLKYQFGGKVYLYVSNN